MAKELSIRLARVITEAAVVFKSDQPAGGVPFHRDLRDQFQDACRFESIRVGEDQTLRESRWIAEGGTNDEDNTLVSALGNERFLAVRLERSSHLAEVSPESFLQQMLANLCDIAGRPPVRLEDAGVLQYSTVVVVELPKPLAQYVEFGQRLWSKLQRHLPGAQGRQEPLISLGVEFQQQVGTRPVYETVVRVEHRGGTDPADGVIFTRSALPLKDHLALLEEVFETTVDREGPSNEVQDGTAQRSGET